MSTRIAERGLDVLGALLLALIIGVIGKRFNAAAAAGQSVASTSPSGQAERRVPSYPSQLLLPPTSFAGGRSTIALLLSVGCPWCEASASFYNDLLVANGGSAFRTIAVLPQTIATSKDYLRSLRVSVDSIYKADLSKLGVEGTPTLLVVDNTGHVRWGWAGGLTAQQEDEVFNKLNLRRPATSAAARVAVLRPAVPTTITTAQLAQELSAGAMVPIVDVRARDQYRQWHIANSVNIPVDELEVRASHELPVHAKVVVYCHYDPRCEVGAHSQGLSTFCSSATYILTRLGFTSLRVVSEDVHRINNSRLRLVFTQGDAGL